MSYGKTAKNLIITKYYKKKLWETLSSQEFYSFCTNIFLNTFNIFTTKYKFKTKFK